MKVRVISMVLGALVTIPEGLEKGLDELEVGGRVDTIQYTDVLVGQITEKSPGFLRRFAVTHTPMKDH